jgi:3-hydroxybutyryl-CoA dehydratase
MSWESERAQAPDFTVTDQGRKHFSEIVIGEEIPTKPCTLTREMIQKFAEVIEDHNPLYFDEEYASKSQFGGLIAPPSIHALLLFECTLDEDDCRATGVINMGQTWSYNVPAKPGDTISLKRTLRDKYVKSNRLWVQHENTFLNQRGTVVCSGGGWRIHER